MSPSPGESGWGKAFMCSGSQGRWGDGEGGRLRGAVSSLWSCRFIALRLKSVSFEDSLFEECYFEDVTSSNTFFRNCTFINTVFYNTGEVARGCQPMNWDIDEGRWGFLIP